VLRKALLFRRDGVVLAIAYITLSRAHRRHSRFINLYAQLHSSPIRRYAWFLSPKLHAGIFGVLSSGSWREPGCSQITLEIAHASSLPEGSSRNWLEWPARCNVKIEMTARS